jgi:hypothetical protein
MVFYLKKTKIGECFLSLVKSNGKIYKLQARIAGMALPGLLTCSGNGWSHPSAMQ